jgi:signal transduction histidine kinase/CheY-like chemotaxis protein
MHFFPTADSTLLSSTINHHNLPPRPKAVGPVFDAKNFKTPVEPWDLDIESELYPPKEDPYAPSAIPAEPSCPSTRYPRSRLAKNERLRLSMLWYYTRDIDKYPELLAGLQEKACLAQENSGWEYAVIGLLDANVYIRLATVGLQLAILPRGETLCAHTVTQPPGNVFLLPNMLEDWRFRESPYVEHGGLIAYAGVPLRIQHESGESVGLGSLCVASATSQPPLSKNQQLALARLGDWIVADIVQCARARRLRERHRLTDLITTLLKEPEGHHVQEPILRILRQAYPDESVTLQIAGTDSYDTNVPYSAADPKRGLWEDDEYIDNFIATSNCNDPPNDRVVRFISARCESKLGQSVLVVATKDIRRIFDDVDSGFVQACATILTQRWQKRILSEVMRAKEKFIRGVSHQLRTPIHGILGAAELLTEHLKALTLLGGSKLPPGVEELIKPLAELGKSSVYLDTISTAGRELMSTVNSMITLNRWSDIASAERQYATHSIQELEDVLVKGLSDVTLRDTSTRVPIFFHNHLPPGCQGLRTDLDLFRDSVLPLIVNAIQNTFQGVITVTLSYTQDTKTLVVDVQDTGCGIDVNDQDRIFQLYEKVGEHSTGPGLGLTLASKFSALLHGSIELVSSVLDRGSHFRCTFGDIRPTTSTPSPTKASQHKNLPQRFHYLTPDSPEIHLYSHISKYLTDNGFVQSNDSTDCLIVMDYIRDSDQRRKYQAMLPEGQVAICLTPDMDDMENSQSASRIVLVKGPFCTSSLDDALGKADELCATAHKPITNPPPSASPSLTKDGRGILPSQPFPKGCGSTDEGYDSNTTSSNNGLPVLQSPIEDSPSAPGDSVPAVVEADKATPLDLPIRTLPSTSKPMTLLVDDNAVNLRILEMYCKKRGLPYRSAIDGQQAIDLFTQQQSSSFSSASDPPFDLILMDLQMPVCDGISATKQIRSLEKTGGKTSILFIVTGQDSQKDREAASEAGADNYLVKPFGIKMLDGTLKRYFPDFAI